MYLVMVEPTGAREEAAEAEAAVALGRNLLEDARDAGHRQPYARFYARENGGWKLVRDRVRRSDLAEDLGRCWCGRGALRGRRPGESWCCAEHEVEWWEMTVDVRARVIAAQFVALHGQKGPKAEIRRVRAILLTSGPRREATIAARAGLSIRRTRAILQGLEVAGFACRRRGCWTVA